MKTTESIPVFSGREYFPKDSLVCLRVQSCSCSHNDSVEAVLDFCSLEQRCVVLNGSWCPPPGASGVSSFVFSIIPP